MGAITNLPHIDIEVTTVTEDHRVVQKDSIVKNFKIV
jgi:hypothetical protein